MYRSFRHGRIPILGQSSGTKNILNPFCLHSNYFISMYIFMKSIVQQYKFTFLDTVPNETSFFLVRTYGGHRRTQVKLSQTT